jgi:RNA polymerase sigma-70 factor (ECF subfamily)
MSAEDRPAQLSFTAVAYDDCAPALDRYLLRRLRNRQDARDLAQEVWMRLLRVENPERVLEPMAYVHRTAGNVLAEYEMRRKREPVKFDSETSDKAADNPAETLPDELLDQVSTQRQMHKMLAKLPSSYRQILLLRLCDGMSYRDIGEKLGLTPSTSEKYFFRALSAMRAAKWD